MTETNQVVSTGQLYVVYDNDAMFTFVDFGLSTWWHEYRDPAQLDWMKSFGASDEWIEKNIIDMLEDVEVMWFASSNEPIVRESEIMCAQVRVCFGEKIVEDGILVVVQEGITSICMIRTNECLSQAEVLDHSNYDILSEMGETYGCLLSMLKPVRYKFDNATESRFLPPSGVLDIPAIKRPGVPVDEDVPDS